MQSSSLHEYRLTYPQTSSEPSLTQTGGLAFILARIEIKKRRLEKRQLRIRNARQAIERIARDIAAFFLHNRPRTLAARPQLRPSLA
jgi:hypothetical protein